MIVIVTRNTNGPNHFLMTSLQKNFRPITKRSLVCNTNPQKIKAFFYLSIIELAFQ